MFLSLPGLCSVVLKSPLPESLLEVVLGDSSDLYGEGPAHCLLNFLLFLEEELLELFEIHFFEIYFGDCEKSCIFALTSIKGRDNFKLRCS